MQKALVKLAYKQIIDSLSKQGFEQDVFNDTYEEFLMQVQVYNMEKKFTTLHEVIKNNPKANSLHYKVGFSIGLYVKNLNNQIPGLKDSLSEINIPFDLHKFEIIESDIMNKSAHKVAITYYTGTLTLLQIIGEYMLLANGDKLKNDSHEPIETWLLKMQPNLSIVSYLESQDSSKRLLKDISGN